MVEVHFTEEAATVRCVPCSERYVGRGGNDQNPYDLFKL